MDDIRSTSLSVFLLKLTETWPDDVISLVIHPDSDCGALMRANGIQTTAISRDQVSTLLLALTRSSRETRPRSDPAHP